ncbi:MAG TPA: MFS transporter [Blastocatellia bacterium]|jgi:MFS family permease|nr:MFS transporter [Blastocatellia bacterium]
MEGLFAERLRRFPLWRPLTDRDFRLLFVGQSVSLFGDQFYLVALPWLTLKLTGSGLALAMVLMVGGGARAVFQLVGGALSDRLSLRAILLISNLVRAIVTALIAVIVLLEITQLWHLVALSLVFGLVDAFFYPAFLAVIPRLVEKDQLTSGNALMRGTNRLMGMIGPAVAGLVIYGVSMPAAFALDTLTFLFATATVWFIKDRRLPAPAGLEPNKEATATLSGLLGSIREGIQYAWRDPLIRVLLFLVTAVEFSFTGASEVGLAVLAKDRFGGGEATAQGAAAFAAMLSALGAGALVGMIAAGSVEMPKRRGKLVAGLSFALGVGLVMLGFASSVLAATIVFGLIGLCGGMANIIILAWIQSRTELGLLGRVMALLMFTVSVVEPISLALAGLLADFDVTLMFAAAGAVLLGTGVLSMASKTLRTSD